MWFSAVGSRRCCLTKIDYEFIDAIQWTPFKRTDDLVRVDPLKQVPTLVLDDGTVMTESAAIVLYGSASGCRNWCPTSLRHAHSSPLDGYVLPANALYALAPFRDFPAKWVDGEEAQKVTGSADVCTNAGGCNRNGVHTFLSRPAQQ